MNQKTDRPTDEQDT